MWNKNWRMKNPDKVKDGKKRSYLKHRTEIRKYQNARVKELHQTLRVECLTHYGNGVLACVCCGESELVFLTIDHEKGLQGEKRRKGYSLWVWLKTHNFPKGFRTMCWNCNSGRSLNGGICPHEIDRTKV